MKITSDASGIYRASADAPRLSQTSGAPSSYLADAADPSSNVFGRAGTFADATKAPRRDDRLSRFNSKLR